MLTPEDANRSVTFTFNAAADAFDNSALGFRDYFGRKTVEKLNLREGARVLDVCCGTGSSAIPAAELVGPSGFVIGIDLADRLLALARERLVSTLCKISLSMPRICSNWTIQPKASVWYYVSLGSFLFRICRWQCGNYGA